MKSIVDYQKDELDALGEDKITNSLNLHRKKLDKTTDIALDLIASSLPDAPLREVIAAYDVTRKHLNVIDGRSESQTVNIFVPPKELQQHYSLAEEIKAQIIEDTKCQNSNKSVSTKHRLKSPQTATASA